MSALSSAKMLGSLSLLLLVVVAASPALSQKVILTSDCPDGGASCQIEIPDTPATAPESSEAEASMAPAGVEAGAATGGVLVLTNLDIGATRDDLLPRVEPESPPVETEVADRVPDWGSEPEVWRSATDEGWVETTGAGPSGFADCMERAIRGDVAYASAQSVCEVLFPQAE